MLHLCFSTTKTFLSKGARQIEMPYNLSAQLSECSQIYNSVFLTLRSLELTHAYTGAQTARFENSTLDLDV